MGQLPADAPAVRLTRRQFLDRAAFERGLRPTLLTRTEDGFMWGERAYTALACRCGFAGCPGWALVHDEPTARTFFTRLFGGAP